MFGNMSFQLLDMVARSKREQDLKEAQDGNLRHQIVASQYSSKRPSAPVRNAPAFDWLALIRNVSKRTLEDWLLHKKPIINSR